MDGIRLHSPNPDALRIRMHRMHPEAGRSDCVAKPVHPPDPSRRPSPINPPSSVGEGYGKLRLPPKVSNCQPESKGADSVGGRGADDPTPLMGRRRVPEDPLFLFSS